MKLMLLLLPELLKVNLLNKFGSRLIKTSALALVLLLSGCEATSEEPIDNTQDTTPPWIDVKQYHIETVCSCMNSRYAIRRRIKAFPLPRDSFHNAAIKRRTVSSDKTGRARVARPQCGYRCVKVPHTDVCAQ